MVELRRDYLPGGAYWPCTDLRGLHESPMPRWPVRFYVKLGAMDSPRIGRSEQQHLLILSPRPFNAVHDSLRRAQARQEGPHTDVGGRVRAPSVREI